MFQSLARQNNLVFHNHHLSLKFLWIVNFIVQVESLSEELEKLQISIQQLQMKNKSLRSELEEAENQLEEAEVKGNKN